VPVPAKGKNKKKLVNNEYLTLTRLWLIFSVLTAVNYAVLVEFRCIETEKSGSEVAEQCERYGKSQFQRNV
jgi:hypothetical protein